METYTTSNLADIFKVSSATIRNEIEKGRLKCFKVGNEARFTQFHIDQYTYVRNFNKTTREIALEAENTKLLEDIKVKDQVLESIKNTLLQGVRL